MPVDSTIGGGNIDLRRVEAARLISIGQHVCSNARWQQNDLPGRPAPPNKQRFPSLGSENEVVKKKKHENSEVCL